MKDTPLSLTLAGVLVIVGAALFGIGYEISVVGEGKAARARMERASESATPLQIQSDIYHAAIGRAAAESRWSLRGHGTLATTGALVGVGLILLGRRRARTSNSDE